MKCEALTYFLAKLIGLTYAILGLSILVRTESFQKTIKSIASNDGIMTLISIFPLIAGLAIVIGHNEWVGHWPVVITIIGWVTLIVGVLRLFFHKTMMTFMAKKAENKSFIHFCGVVLLIVGVYLIYMSFFA